MAMLQLQQIFIAVTGLYVISAVSPRIEEAVYNVNVTEGNSAELIFTINGVTNEHKIFWWIRYNVETLYCEIEASPSRNVRADEISNCNLIFARFEGTVIEHTRINNGNSVSDQFRIVIPDVKYNDTNYSITCFYQTSNTRTTLIDYFVSIHVYSPTLQTTSSTMSTVSNRREGTLIIVTMGTPGSVIGGSIACALVVLFLAMITILLIFLQEETV